MTNALCGCGLDIWGSGGATADGTSHFLHYAGTADRLRAQWPDGHGEEVLPVGTLASRTRPSTHCGAWGRP